MFYGSSLKVCSNGTNFLSGKIWNEVSNNEINIRKLKISL